MICNMLDIRTTHGKFLKIIEYQTWKAFLSRCLNKFTLYLNSNSDIKIFFLAAGTCWYHELENHDTLKKKHNTYVLTICSYMQIIIDYMDKHPLCLFIFYRKTDQNLFVHPSSLREDRTIRSYSRLELKSILKKLTTKYS